MSTLLLRFAAIALIVFALPAHAQSTLRIHGSNTIGERLAPALAEAWLQSRGYSRIERFAPAVDEITLRGSNAAGSLEIELRAHGSSTGFADLFAGKADLAMSSRPVSAAELARGAALGPLDAPSQEAVLALDGVAVIVHPDNRLREVRLEQLRDIFAGRVRDWSQLGGAPGRIVLHARDANSGTWETFRTLVLGENPLRGDAQRYESTHELARAVAADRNTIGFVSLAGIGDARALAVADAGAALKPAPFTVAVEDYVLSRRLYVYGAENMPPLARAFIEFAQSAEGQRVVESAGFIAQQVRAYRAPPRRDAPEEYRDLVRNADRLSLNFRFGTGSSLLDSKARVDLERVAEFMRRPENRDRPLMLFGFADAGEISPYQALTLSNDRVDYIAGRLEELGLRPSRLRGMGGAAPVASNDNAAGRHRNRRVEVWVGPATVATAGGSR